MADVVLAQEVLHLRGRVRVDEVPPPRLGLVGPARTPDREGARLEREGRRGREDGAGPAEEPALRAPPATALLLARAEVFGGGGGVLVRGRGRRVAGPQG